MIIERIYQGIVAYKRILRWKFHIIFPRISPNNIIKNIIGRESFDFDIFQLDKDFFFLFTQLRRIFCIFAIHAYFNWLHLNSIDICLFCVSVKNICCQLFSKLNEIWYRLVKLSKGKIRWTVMKKIERKYMWKWRGQKEISDYWENYNLR